MPRRTAVSLVVLNLLVAALYWAVAAVSIFPSTALGRATPLWPPIGIALAAVLFGGPRLLPGVALGSFAATSTFFAFAAAWPVAAGVVGQVSLDAWLLRRGTFDPRLLRVRDPLLLIACTLAGALVGGLGGGLGMVASGAAVDNWPRAYAIWVAGDWLGAIIISSLALTWVHAPRIRWSWSRAGEAAVLIAIVITVIQLLRGLWVWFPGENVPLGFMFFPLVGYAGMRFGPAGAAALTVMVSTFVLVIMGYRLGPFGAMPVLPALLILQLFLILGWWSGQTLAAVRAEWDAALERHLALEEQLRHAQKMEAIGRLAGGIAHDFNNLLTAIIGYTEIVTVSLDPADPRRADTEEISRAAMRAAALTRQMLAFSRRQVLQPQVIDLNTAIRRAQPLLTRLIGADVVLTTTLRASQPQVRVDPGQLEQVLMNLVVNARDAMPGGGRLTVETANVTIEPGKLTPDVRPGAYVMLVVSDTGSGMSADVRHRIFEPYFTTKDVGKGTGLGLSTAYGIVRQSEGDIQVQSEPGHGTTFRIYLPWSELDQTVETTAAAEERIPGGGEQVLLIEDDPMVRRLSRDVLIRLGYSVTEAASGRAGLALGSDETRHFDLVLSDVVLGDMSGPAVGEALRALRPQVRVLYMSGHAEEAIIRSGALGEGQPFLAKPFSPRELALALRAALDYRESLGEDA